jgi:hypothetical protein
LWKAAASYWQTNIAQNVEQSNFGIFLLSASPPPACLVRDFTAAKWASNSYRVASKFPSKSPRRLWNRYPTMDVTPFNCLSSLLVIFSSISAWSSFTFKPLLHFVALVFFAGAPDTNFHFQPFFNEAHAAASFIFNGGYVTLY